MRRWILLAGVAVALAVGGFLVGRLGVDTATARHTGYRQGQQAGYRQGQQAGYDRGHLNGYFDGLQAGEAQGRQEGRAEQEVTGLADGVRARVRAAFQDGYAAGANDVFAGYDGGWSYGTKYVITLAPGRGAIVYRIASRDR